MRSSEELADGFVLAQPDRPRERLFGFVGAPDLREQVGPERPVGLVGRDRLAGNRVDGREGGLGPPHFRERRRVSDASSGGGRAQEQSFVEERDCLPVRATGLVDVNV